MNPYTRYQSLLYKDATGWSREVHDAWLYYGPLFAERAAVEGRHEQIRRWVALWSMTHPGHARSRGAWRRWLGAFLVRMGTRLQGLPALAAPAPAGNQ